MEKGQRFAIREGGRTIGAGRVSGSGDLSWNAGRGGGASPAPVFSVTGDERG
jgi:hypothetical protein